jgi:mannonate dehydratase
MADDKRSTKNEKRRSGAKAPKENDKRITVEKNMKLTFRWFGENDAVPIKYIAQIPGIYGVVTALYGIPAGEIWPLDAISKLKGAAESHGLAAEVIESVPVHEDIKLGLPSRDRYIKNYIETLKNLGAAGFKCVCYNFMPVFDWVRTDLKLKNADGSTSLAYREEEIRKLDKNSLSLPGWDESYTKEELSGLLESYNAVTPRKLFENLVYFLEALMPALEETGINMAIHPDDPPWEIFGLPRIISAEDGLDKLFAAVPSKHNGLAFCTGSLGAKRANDLPRLAKKYAEAGRIHFAHLRNIAYDGDLSFRETAHNSASGSLDMFVIVSALVRGGFSGYVRPDHGRNIFGEEGKPGYGLYDRALGAAYLNGLFEAAEKMVANS